MGRYNGPSGSASRTSIKVLVGVISIIGSIVGCSGLKLQLGSEKVGIVYNTNNPGFQFEFDFGTNGWFEWNH